MLAPYTLYYCSKKPDFHKKHVVRTHNKQSLMFLQTQWQWHVNTGEMLVRRTQNLRKTDLTFQSLQVSLLQVACKIQSTLSKNFKFHEHLAILQTSKSGLMLLKQILEDKQLLQRLFKFILVLLLPETSTSSSTLVKLTTLKQNTRL